MQIYCTDNSLCIAILIDTCRRFSKQLSLIGRTGNAAGQVIPLASLKRSSRVRRYIPFMHSLQDLEERVFGVGL